MWPRLYQPRIDMRKLAQGALLGAVVLLAGLHLDHGFVPSRGDGGEVSLEAGVVPADWTASAESSVVTTGHVRAFLQRNRIPFRHLDLRTLVDRVNQASARHRLEPAMVLAVIQVESTFRPDAISHKGAVGLMQILPRTGEELAAEMGVPWEGEYQLLEPDLNIELGAYYLRKLLDRFDGDRTSALEAYFQGPNRLVAWRRDRDRTIPYLYARRVLPYWEELN